jgi:serine/threonine-protein kinase
MGAVFEAVQLGLGRRVAVKVMLDRAMRAPDSLARFRREATGVAAIRHPGIVQVQDLGTDTDGSPFMVMERLDGASVTDMLDEMGALPIDRATWIAREALDALAVAHQHGLVHRDVKPSNLFVARDGRGGEQVKLLDFGLAKATDDARDLTRTGFALGSAPYMSPEQTQDAKRADARADVYGMGVAMFEMLTGHLPVSGSTEVEVMMRVATGEITRHPRWIRQAVPAAIDAVVARALAKEPAARYPTALAMRAALIEAEGAPVRESERGSWPTLAGEPAPRVSRPRRTSRIPAIVAPLTTGSMDEALAPTTEMHATPLPPMPSGPPQERGVQSPPPLGLASPPPDASRSPQKRASSPPPGVPLAPQGRTPRSPQARSSRSPQGHSPVSAPGSEGRRSRATLPIMLVVLLALLGGAAYFGFVHQGADGAALALSVPSTPVVAPPPPPAPPPGPAPTPTEGPAPSDAPPEPVIEAVTPVTSVTPVPAPTARAAPIVRQGDARALDDPARAGGEAIPNAPPASTDADEDPGEALPAGGEDEDEDAERVDLGFGPVGVFEGVPPTRVLLAAIRRSNPRACGHVGAFPIAANVSGITGAILTVNVSLHGEVLNCVERSLRRTRFPRSTLQVYQFNLIYEP